MTGLEVAANLTTAISILLAARNSVHTWWTGMLGCALFGWLFFGARLYADVTLQILFIATSAAGWWWWARGSAGAPSPVSRARPALLGALGAASLVLAIGYGALLHLFTNAFAPFVDSLVLALSLMAQLLLVRRMVETWWVWLAVDTIAVPLFASRGLYLTAGLYAGFWLNAWYGWWRWRRELQPC